MCEACLEWYRNNRKKSLTRGLCICGKAITSGTTCDSCKARKAEWAQRNFAKLKAAGLCTGCGRPTNRSAVTCTDCSAKRVQHGRRRLGVTIESFNAVAESQGGMCAICLEVPKVLCVDHDHTTGKVRQLLCHRCNRVLGLCGEDKALLLALSAYITRHGAQE